MGLIFYYAATMSSWYSWQQERGQGHRIDDSVKTTTVHLTYLKKVKYFLLQKQKWAHHTNQ